MATYTRNMEYAATPIPGIAKARGVPVPGSRDTLPNSNFLISGKVVAKHVTHGGRKKQKTNTAASRSKSPLLIRAAIAETIGRRESNEDAYIMLLPSATCPATIVGIFDGHGGADVSKLIASKIESMVLPLFNKKLNISSCLHEMVHYLDKKVLYRYRMQGCTFILCMMDSTSGEGYIISIGDSTAHYLSRTGTNMVPLHSAVVMRRSHVDVRRRKETLHQDSHVQHIKHMSYPLNPLHDTSYPNVARRIVMAGGKIIEGNRVSSPGTSMGLNLTNTVGDHADGVCRLNGKIMPGEFQPISCTPFITPFQLNTGDTLLLACDGLTEALSEVPWGAHHFSENVDAIRRDPAMAHGDLARALSMTVQRSMFHSGDNISALVLQRLNTNATPKTHAAATSSRKRKRSTNTISPVNAMFAALSDYPGTVNRRWRVHGLPDTMVNALVHQIGSAKNRRDGKLHTVYGVTNRPSAIATVHDNITTTRSAETQRLYTILESVWNGSVQWPKVKRVYWTRTDGWKNGIVSTAIIRACTTFDWKVVDAMLAHIRKTNLPLLNNENMRGYTPHFFLQCAIGQSPADNPAGYRSIHGIGVSTAGWGEYRKKAIQRLATFEALLRR